MRYILKAILVVLAIGLFIIRPSLSYADTHDGHAHDGSHVHSGGRGHDSGHSHGGGWHGRSYVGIDFSVWPGSYYYGGPYYPDDSVLVSPPVYEPVVQQPVTVIEPSAVIDNQDQSLDSFTVNIPNDKGGYTAVIIKKSGNGFTGPQGEFYPKFPTVAQLKVMYGK